MDFSDLIKDYLDDAGGHIKAYDAALLDLEKGGFNKEIVTDTLGTLHTLKGNSGMMGYESLKDYIHQIEGILKKVNDGKAELGPVMETLLESANVIRNALQAIAKEPSSNPDLSKETSVLTSCLSASAKAAPDAPETKKKAIDVSSYLGTKTDTIKVDFKRLDDLLNLVGELVIFKTRLNQIESQLRPVVADKSLVKDLDDGLELMGKTISGLQEGIMRVRMLPVSHVFNKFPRMVRDLARSQAKDIRLLFSGEETELDKTVIDELEEPLLHIIRNAVDHGIETIEERRARGKDGQGTMRLSAAQESNYVIIKVTDDGRGISADEIRETAIHKGLIKPDEVLEREHLMSLIFAPGFSTKKEATDISGRGIGLDVVNKNITKLNGHIIVDSTPGKGTTFTIKLPLSLAIIPALMAETGGEVYAIPLSSVDESIKVREDDIHIINNREVIKFRNRVIPVLRLDDFFNLEKRRKKRFYLVIIGRSEKSLALAVDSLRGQQEIVIKPLDETFGKSYGIAGASILGDGRIVLIVDVLSFWSRTERSSGGAEEGMKAEEA